MTEQTPRTRATLPDTAVCLQCGYSLRALGEDRCPECGRAFDPTDAESYWDSDRPAWSRLIWRRWAAPPPFWHSALCIVTVIFLHEAIQFNGLLIGQTSIQLRVLEPSIILAASLAIGLTLSQFIRRWAIRWCYWSRWNEPDALTRSVARRWRALTVCWLLGIVAVVGWPLLPPASLPFMEWKTRTVLQANRTETGLQMVGLLPVTRVHPLPDGSVKFEVGSGLAIRYVPFGRPLPPNARATPLRRFWVMKW